MIFNLFKKKKKSITISIQDIDEWIKKSIESKNLGLKIGILKREINSKKIKLRELLKDLDSTGVKDESVIPERAKNIFEGNKHTYVQKLNVFLDNLIIPEDVSQLESFLENTSLNLANLAEDTNKNYFIIKEFAEDESRQVVRKLKELDDLISNSRALMEKTSLSKFKGLKKLLEEYHDSIRKVEETKKLMENVLEKKGEEIDRKKKIESKILIMKKSPQHEEYDVLKNKRESLDDEIKKIEYTIINLFSGISSVLKKYSKKKRNAISKEYSDNSVNALLSDEKLSILKVLEDVKKIKDSLDVKDSKLKKLESDINSIKEKELNKLRTSLIKLNQDKKDLENRLKNHSFRLNLKEQEGKLNIIHENIKEIEKEEEEIENLLERINPRLVKQKMKYLIKDLDERTDLI